MNTPADNSEHTITLILPLNAHGTPAGRQRNLKLHDVMRWFAYMQNVYPRFYYCVNPGSHSALPHGALCLQFGCNQKKGTDPQSPAYQELLHRLQAEKLTPWVLPIESCGRHHTHLPHTAITPATPPHQHEPASYLALPRHKYMESGHVPTFARAYLHTRADRPLGSIACEPASYNALFGLS